MMRPSPGGRRIQTTAAGLIAWMLVSGVAAGETASSKRTVRMLGTGTPCTWSVREGTLEIAVPDGLRDEPPCEHAWAFEIRGNP